MEMEWKEVIRPLREDELDESLDLSCFAFQYELTEEERAERKSFTLPGSIWGCFVGDKMAAKMTIHPLQLYINGQPIPMGGVASVATWPEFRRQGMVARLLRKGLEVMKAEGRTISCLHPFAISFYRKYGWELYIDYVEYELDASHLPKGLEASGTMTRVARDPELLSGIYEAYAAQYNGMLARDARWWKYFVFRQKKGQAVVYRDGEGRARGYMLYEMKNRQMKIGELIWLDMDAWAGLWKFIVHHDSMFQTITLKVPADDPLPFLLDNPDARMVTTPYFMARLVDVAGFLGLYRFEGVGESVSLQVKITDRQAPWNDGCFEWAVAADGRAAVKRVDVEGEVDASPELQFACDIGTLTAMLMGYKRPSALHRFGRLKAEARTIEMLELLVPRTSTYLSDYY
ncbi:GNAT family N-acetyltransferase [Paenibacillus koleovorans]|uniref:GNAT family N-acetyltransferase n=1 Tax=Paenibacillus koleovorans TaxID=121608 RepID=UPI0013E34E88|nr:GNAT family N-acetyltransferase [Paenibacillus koleovorans]